jgi:hypothetical protein
MPALANELAVEAERMLAAAAHNHVDGEDVARAIGRDPEDADVHHAFREVERQGRLKIEGWRGGMGLPAFVSLP